MDPRRAVLALVPWLALLAVSGVVAAQASTDGRLDSFSAPASKSAASINQLYDLILPVSIVIGVMVEAFILYAIFRFRAKSGKVTDSGEHERGHTKLEIAWTIPPALILLMVGLLSANTLGALDNPPANAPTDFYVNVKAAQFVWTFEYPDGSAGNKLAIEEGKVVRFNVTSSDVIHSFAVPALGIKIDAIPGRINHYWVKADIPGEYQVQCMEYCGLSHAYMRAQAQVVAKGSTPHGWVPPGGTGPSFKSCAEVPAPAADAPAGTPLAPTKNVTVELLEGGGNPWSVRPGSFTASPSDRLCLDVKNPAGQTSPHNLTIIQGNNGPRVATSDALIQPGKESVFLVPPLAAGEYTYYCNVPGHRQLGMEGKLTVS